MLYIPIMADVVVVLDTSDTGEHVVFWTSGLTSLNLGLLSNASSYPSKGGRAGSTMCGGDDIVRFPHADLMCPLFFIGSLVWNQWFDNLPFEGCVLSHIVSIYLMFSAIVSMTYLP
jgi:hypothetical protein